MARRNSVAIPWLYRGVGGSVLVLSWSRRRSPASTSSFGLGMRRHGPFVANCMYLNIKRLSSLARALSHHTSSAFSILPLDLLSALALTTRQYYTPEPLTYTPHLTRLPTTSTTMGLIKGGFLRLLQTALYLICFGCAAVVLGM